MQATTNAVAPVPSTASMSKWTVALWLSTFESAALSPSYTASSSASSSADCASSESDALPSEKSDGAPAVLLDASSLALRPPSDIAAAAQPTQLSLSLSRARSRERSVVAAQGPCTVARRFFRLLRSENGAPVLGRSRRRTEETLLLFVPPTCLSCRRCRKLDSRLSRGVWPVRPGCSPLELFRVFAFRN